MIVILIALVGFILITNFWPRASHQPLAEAKRFYDKGTDALRDGAYYQASKALERAISVDDKFLLAHARLAEAWAELDYSDKAKDELLRMTAVAPDRSALPPLEALYLKAITETVAHDFGSAIESYHSISEQVPEAEKPFAYVDLGRAFEKNEEVKKAIESFENATKLDPQYAAAFLRLGVVHGRQQDLERAADAFQKAQQLYHDLSNQEGEAEALYQRGSLLNKVGKIAEARLYLEKALAINKPTDNKYQLIRTLLQLSRVAGSEGNTQYAREVATQAIDSARSDGLENLTTQGLLDLGHVFLTRNELKIAEEYFKQALDFAQKNKGLRNEARAFLMLGNLRMQQDDADGARRYVEQAIPFYQRGGYSKESWQALYLLGHSNDLKGDYSNALQAFNQQLELAQKWGDKSQIALSHEGIGTVLAHQEGYKEALSHFDECYKLYNSLGKKLNAGYASLNRGDMLWQLGRYQEATVAINQAAAIAELPEGGYRQLSGRVCLIKARLALSQHRLSEAKAFGQQAVAIATTQSEHTAVEAKNTLGLAQALAGEKRQGRLSCEQAVVEARRTGDPRLVDSALLTLAETLLLSGDAKNALTTALQAQASFARTGRQDSEWRACLIVGLAGQVMADFSITREFLLRANNLVEALKQKWGNETYATYSARTDIASYSKRLNEVSMRAI